MGNYVQPNVITPAENPNIGIKPLEHGNPMAISLDGVKKENYVQPDYRPVTVDPRVGIRPMKNGQAVGEE